MSDEIDNILNQIDELIASRKWFDLDEYINSYSDPNNYYSARFINQIHDRRRKPTLAQAQSILNTVENAIEQYDDEEAEANDRGYDDEPGDRPSIWS